MALQKFPAEDEKNYLPVIKIKELREGFTSLSDKASTNIDEKYIITDGDILFSWSGSLMVVIWGEGKGALNQHLFKVSSKYFEKWFYYFWTRYHLQKFIGIAEDKVTTMGHIKREHLTSSKVLVPNSTTIKKMDMLMKPLLNKIIKNKIESRNILLFKENLLPKLMSGQVRAK